MMVVTRVFLGMPGSLLGLECLRSRGVWNIWKGAETNVLNVFTVARLAGTLLGLECTVWIYAGSWKLVMSGISGNVLDLSLRAKIVRDFSTVRSRV